jgi:hypothetical protein
VAVYLSPAEIVSQDLELRVRDGSTVETRHWRRDRSIAEVCGPEIDIVCREGRYDGSDEFTEDLRSENWPQRVEI